MVRIVATFLLIFVFSHIMGQIPEWQKDLPACIFISAENLIRVGLNGTSAEDIQVKATGAQVQQRNDTTFQITPTQFQDDVKLKLYYKNILCGVKQFSVRYLPDIDIIIPGEKNGIIKKKGILAVQNFEITSSKNFEDLGLLQNLKHYNVVISDQRNVSLYSEQVQQDGLSEKMKNIILNAKSGLTMRLSNTKLEGINGHVYPVYFSKAWYIAE